MTDLRKKSFRGVIVNVTFVVLLMLTIFILSTTMSDNEYRRKLVPILWHLCIFILLGTSLNLTMGFLGELALGHMGFMGIGAYTAALSSLALERAGLFSANSASPFMLITVMLGSCLFGALMAALFSLLLGIPGAPAARGLSGNRDARFWPDYRKRHSEPSLCGRQRTGGRNRKLRAV